MGGRQPVMLAVVPVANMELVLLNFYLFPHNSKLWTLMGV